MHDPSAHFCYAVSALSHALAPALAPALSLALSPALSLALSRHCVRHEASLGCVFRIPEVVQSAELGAYWVEIGLLSAGL